MSQQDNVTIRGKNKDKVQATTYNGFVDVYNDGSWVLVDTHNGDVDVCNKRSRVLVDTHNGDVKVDNDHGAVEARTHNGDVKVDNHGESVHVKSYNGGVVVGNHGKTVRIRTYHGDVCVQSDRGDVLVDTYSGNVDVIIDAGAYNEDVQVKIDRNVGRMEITITAKDNQAQVHVVVNKGTFTQTIESGSVAVLLTANELRINGRFCNLARSGHREAGLSRQGQGREFEHSGQ